jgi:hypothetical protein
MKKNISRRSVAISALVVFLVSGVIYSAAALSAKPAFASSCDCADDLQEARAYCSSILNGNLASFTCPDVINGQAYYEFTCTTGGGQNFQEPCVD